MCRIIVPQSEFRKLMFKVAFIVILCFLGETKVCNDKSPASAVSHLSMYSSPWEFSFLACCLQTCGDDRSSVETDLLDFYRSKCTRKKVIKISFIPLRISFPKPDARAAHFLQQMRLPNLNCLVMTTFFFI